MEAVLLSKRAASLSADLASSHGEVIAFDSGHGFPSLFPDLTAEAAAALTLYRDETLQYGSRAGLGEFREWIAEFLNRQAMRVAPDDIVITNGAKQGIELICQVLLDEGDSLVVTAPTYHTAIPIFRSYGAEFIEIDQDAEGLDIDELAAALDRRQKEGRRKPKLIYDNPRLSQPDRRYDVA